VPAAIPSLSPWGTRKRLGYGAMLGLVVAGLLQLLRGTHAMEALELRLVDVRTRAFVGQRGPDPRIVLCLIHEEDHEQFTRSDYGVGEGWPWPLYAHEYVFLALGRAQPKAVLIDMLHLDRGLSAEDVDATAEQREQGWFGALVAEAEQAGELSKAYAALGVVALGFQLDEKPSKHEQEERVKRARARVGLGAEFSPEGGVVRAHATLPVSGLIPGVRTLAFTNVQPDVDGVQRRAIAVGRWGQQTVASLPLAGAWLASDAPREVKDRTVRLGDATQRLGEGGDFYVNFRGSPGQVYAQIPPRDLVEIGFWIKEKKPEDEWRPGARERLAELKDKIVVYGAHLAGAEDTVASPLSGSQFGPEYQATILDNLLHGDGRVAVSRGVNAALLLALCLVCAALGTLGRGRWLPHVVAIALIVVLGVVAWGLFARGHVLDVVTPAVGIVLAWGGASVLRLATEGRRNKWLEGTFGRYVSPEVIEALKKDPDLLALGGRRRDLTILFSDVAGFTKLSEELGAENIVTLLNRYLTAQGERVIANGGVIDKYIGDAVMAFWGDPLDTPDHALRAVKAGLACQATLPALRPLLDELGVKAFDMRIGISSGPAVVGNMGSEERFSYTCMGDTVNLASRLEGANKAFGSRLMVAAPTYLMVRDQVVARRLADLQVVGRKDLVRVYEVLSLREDAAPALLQLVEAWNRAHEALRRGDLGAAEAALTEAARLRPGDKPTAWLADLAARMRAGTAPTPWDGTVAMTEK
jgi:adenylate cyclase